ncbi:MAG TPA: S41 family peptidase [Stellaceae bacterium]|nr:S41 family peptidase [Stellaceae bacterium]
MIAFAFRHRIFAPLLAAIVLLTLTGCGAAPTAHQGSAPVVNTASDADMALYNRVLGRVRASYVEPVDDSKLIAYSLKGMLTSLDPHSDFLTESEYQELLDEAEGEFAGIGAEISREDSLPKVISPIDNTPAARAGLKPGDIILKIDGKLTDGMSLKEVVDRLRGPVGSAVNITIGRVGERAFNVTLTRAVIHVASVTSHLEPDKIGYIRLSLFAERTNQDLVRALGDLTKKAGGRLNGVVLDLRNDPGGLLDQAVLVAGDFLDGGVVVSTRGRDPDDNHVFNASAEGDRARGVPVVVLINGASASASEIVAGALKERHRAEILGTRSFGKGSVQTIIPMDGKGAVRLTTALYYTPSGHSIQGEGIVPDVLVLPPKEQRGTQLDVVHEADLSGAIRNPGKLGATDTGPEANIDPMLIGTPKDYQLKVALDRLMAEAGHNRTAAAGGR